MGYQWEEVKFTEIIHDVSVGEVIDAYFMEHGWKLLRIENGQSAGYQVFFGEGVQVDNHFEWGFSHFLEKDQLLSFAEGFYQRIKEAL